MAQSAESAGQALLAMMRVSAHKSFKKEVEGDEEVDTVSEPPSKRAKGMVPPVETPAKVSSSAPAPSAGAPNAKAGAPKAKGAPKASAPAPSAGASPSAGATVTPETVDVGQLAAANSDVGQVLTGDALMSSDDKSKAAAIAKASEEAAAEHLKGKEAADDKERRLANGQAIRDAMSPAERKNSWARYIHSHKGCSSGEATTEKCPEAVSLQMVSLSGKQMWYKIWLDCGESWLKVTATETFAQINTELTRKAKAWLCESQIADLYKSAAIASGIVKRLKEKAGCWRPHPEVPDMPEAVQYFVMVEDSMREDLQRVHSKQLSFLAQMDPAAGSRLAAQLQPNNAGAQASPPMSIADAGNAGAGGDGAGGLPLSFPGAASGLPAGSPAQSQFDVAVEKAQKAAQTALAKAKEVEQRRLDKKNRLAAEKEAKKQADEDFKHTPQGKATKWLKDCNNLMDTCATVIVAIKSYELAAGMQNEWTKTFQQHSNKLKKAKANAEQVRDGKKDNLDLLKQGSETLAAFQKDKQIYDALL